MGAIAGGIALSWALAWVLGGAAKVPPLWFYAPVLLAAFRFGPVGAVATGVLSGVVAGPLLPDHVADHVPQAFTDWFSRGLFFTGTGLIASWMFATSARAFAAERRSVLEERDREIEAVEKRRLAEELAAERERELQATTERQELESRLRRAFEMTDGEATTLDVVHRALGELVPGLAGELLLADSSHSHLERAVAVAHGGRPPGCTVATPWGCPAMRTGRTQVFQSSRDFDSCPHLQGREGDPCSALCAPVTFMGSTNGVIHVLAPEGAPPPPAQRHLLGVVAAQAGASLGMHRAYATSQVRASTDALTGLLNRRSLDEIGSRLRRSEDQVGVVLGDLDHFKDLNDRHGHEAGDRALRLFAQVLRDTSRDGDVVGRWGGEEFLLLLPGATADIAAALAGRVRQALAATLASGVVPSFSASFGVSELSRYPSYEEALTAADRALYRAKRDGRDRVVVDEAGSGDSGAVPAG